MGNVALSLPVLPFDAYQISFLIHHGETDPALTHTVVERIRQLNSRQPIVFSLSVFEGNAQEIGQSGSTRDWHVGSRHPFSPEMSFDRDTLLFPANPGLLEFDGVPFNRYTIQFNISDIGGVAREYPTTILVAGNRDDGYYPLGPILLLTASVPLFFVLVVVNRRIARSYERA